MDGSLLLRLAKFMIKFTNRKDPLRRYVVDSFVFKSVEWNTNMTMNEVRSQSSSGNHAFVADCYAAAMDMAAKNKVKDPNEKHARTYHVN